MISIELIFREMPPARPGISGCGTGPETRYVIPLLIEVNQCALRVEIISISV